jgi:hypothetical protein
MHLCAIYEGLGNQAFYDLLRSVSLGKLKTYQMFERLKIRLRLTKLNSETLLKSAPRHWDRIVAEKDEEFATELAQAILICHMDLIVDVLNFLQIPHEEGFFAKDADVSALLTEGWQQRVWDRFSNERSKPVLALYLNHLSGEMAPDLPLFLPAL